MAFSFQLLSVGQKSFVRIRVYSCFSKKYYGVPAEPSGFPLYLFSLRSQRMPLQSLTREGLQRLLAVPILINKVYFWAFSFHLLSAELKRFVRIRAYSRTESKLSSRSVDDKKRIVAASCIFACRSMTFCADNPGDCVHVFRVFWWVCDIFIEKSAWNLSLKSLFRGLNRHKKGKKSAEVFCNELRDSG